MRATCKRLAALALAAVLCAGLLPRASAAGRTVAVADAQALVELAERCVLDSYSQGLTVTLTADIDLTGADFRPIPVFCGVFDGGGHTVTGFQFTGKGSDQGFFRYVKEGAVVRDLTVSGIVAPDGSKTGVGGLCGVNEGTLEGCTVLGRVEGLEDVGGVAGVNLGTVKNCVSRAAVTGTTHTGGVAGRSEGTLDGCANHGGVNVEANDKAEDTGGIVGLSTGSVAGCQNYGAVGYQHTGYNVGGVAGRQNGSVVGCGNSGEIKGRKDVGGVVGQFEPHTTLAYGQDPTQRLDDELSKLSGLMTRLAGQVNDTAGLAVEDMQAINDALDAIRDTANGAGTEGRDDAQAASDQIYDAVQTINSALDGLLDHVDAFSADANRSLDDAGAAMDRIRDSLDRGFDAVGGDLDSARDSLDWDLGLIERDGAEIKKQLENIGRDIGTIQSVTANIGDIMGGDGGLLDRLEAVSRELERLDGLNISGDVEKIGKALGGIGGALEALRHDLGEDFDDLDEDASKMWDGVNAAAGDLSDAADRLNDIFKTFSDAATGDLKTVNSSVDDVEDVLKDWLDTAGDKGQARLDDVDGQLQSITDRVDKMTGGAASANSDLHDTTSDIIGQLDAVRDALKDLAQPPEKSVDDVSDSVEQEGDRGRVVSCANQGPVQADANVGGVVGTVAAELGLDPEEDLDLESDKLLVDTTAYIKATVRDCRNTAAVTAKNDCVGGIVGRAEVGAVLDCFNGGDVETTGGSLCGGVAGLSRTVIRRSHALCALTGTDRVGGVAGEGHDLRECHAMVTIDAGGERLGAIAGDADGEVLDCRFVREDLAGIDGVDYAGRAQSMPYQEFIQLPGLPEAFRGLSITFTAEGRTVKTLPVAYGASLVDADIPPVPEKEGLHGDWADFPRKNITRSRTVEAIYRDWTTALSYGEPQAELLVEGAFAPEAYLAVQPWTPDAALVPAGYRVAAGYSFGVEHGDGSPQGQTYTVHVKTDGENAQIGLLEDGRLTAVPARRDGSYLLFETNGGGSVAVLTKPRALGPGLIAALCAAAAAVLAGVILAVRRGKKKRKKGLAKTA